MVNLVTLRGLRQKSTLKKENRTPWFSDKWKGMRTKFMGITIVGGILLMLWFLAVCSYIYGSLFKSGTRHHNMRLLGVDYDGGVIGQSLTAAYNQIKGPSFVTIDWHTPEEYPTEDDMFQAVRKGKFWGAISASPGASDRLEAALQGGQAALTYNPANALHYVWNQQYYTIFAMSVVNPSLQQLVGATRIAYNKIHGTQASQALNNQDPAAVQALLNPIQASERNVKAASFGSSVLLGTVGSVTPVLAQFFFLLVLTGVMREMKLFSKLNVRSSFIYRRIATVIYTFGAALVQAGYTWAFREEWDQNGNQFVLSWMVYWLEMNANLVIIDFFITLFPMPVMPYMILAWIFINISSTLSPLELQPGYYKWSIITPGHNAYSALVTIWTGGAVNRLYRALPILFAWIVAGLVAVWLAHCRACHVAYKLEHENSPDLAKDVEAGHSTEGFPMSTATTFNKGETPGSSSRLGSADESTPQRRQV